MNPFRRRKPANQPTIAGLPVNIVEESITDLTADAYLVPQTALGSNDAGVAKAVFESCGRSGAKAYEELTAKAGGSLPHGTAHLTEAGGGNADYLLHAVTHGRDGFQNKFDTVQNALLSALELAAEKGITSIAVPVLGTGEKHGRLSYAQSALAMSGAILKFKHRNPKAKMNITFSAYNSDTKQYFSFMKNLDTETTLPASVSKSRTPERRQNKGGIPRT